MTKKLFLRDMGRVFSASLVVTVMSLGNAACGGNDDNPVNNPEPTDMVRLVSTYDEITTGLITATIQVNNVWENGRLIRQTQTTAAMGVCSVVDQILTYDERGLCTEMYSADGSFHHYYTYTSDGCIAKEEHIIDDHTADVTEVLAYDADGNITEIRYTVPPSSVTRNYHLTWQDGDLVKVVVDYVTEGKESSTYTYAYDNYPSAYIGYPIALGINNIPFLAIHCCKHNLKETGVTPSYENGRLVELVKDDGSGKTFFTYDDGTGQR